MEKCVDSVVDCFIRMLGYSSFKKSVARKLLYLTLFAVGANLLMILAIIQSLNISR